LNLKKYSQFVQWMERRLVKPIKRIAHNAYYITMIHVLVFQFTTMFTFSKNHGNIGCMSKGWRLLTIFKFFQRVTLDSITYTNPRAKDSQICIITLDDIIAPWGLCPVIGQPNNKGMIFCKNVLKNHICFELFFSKLFAHILMDWMQRNTTNIIL